MTEHKKLYRISEIERLTGVPRRRIHFYIQSELLHRPIKTGQTMAYYDQSHIQRLELIKKAKERGEPLFAIREMVRDMLPEEPLSVSDYYRASPDEELSISSDNAPYRRRDSERTRERILEAGCKMFRESGFSKTRINDLTRYLDIGKGTFYFYFHDKRALFLECVPRLFAEMFSEGWEDIRKVYNPVERLEMRFDLVLTGLKDFCAILQLTKEAMADDDPDLKRLGEKTYLSIRKPLESDIKRGIKQGLFQPVNVEMAASLMIAVVENIFYMKAMSSEISPEVLKVNLFNLLAFGLAGIGDRMTVKEAAGKDK
ncbi:MAG: MerR family transcriptional regulator [Desulfosudaceae bacterium]